MCVCIYAHTYTHCIDGVLGCEPMSRDETPGEPEEFRWTKSGLTYIRICVQSTHVYVYPARRDEILDYLFFPLSSFSFQKRKEKDVNANHQ